MKSVLTWIENPRVASSILAPATIKSSSDILWDFFTSRGYADLYRNAHFDNLIVLVPCENRVKGSAELIRLGLKLAHT